MRRRLDCILLIDDDEPTNVYHEMVILEADCAEMVVTVESGQEALDFLQSKQNGTYPCPDLIFLDINMPAMNGWEFLGHYKKLDVVQKGQMVIVMLTTSLNPDDREKANNMSDISGFKSKPLTVEMLHEIIDTHFPG